MPRKARIDAPGALHHIIIRGIERNAIFKDDSERDPFLDRLGASVSVFIRVSKTGRKTISLLKTHFSSAVLSNLVMKKA
ncbi:MAG: hypothetical protein WCB15_16865 [Desulfobacterales bacterium]